MLKMQPRIDLKILASQPSDIFSYHSDLKNRDDLTNSLVLLGVTPLWQVAQWVSRVPPHHTLSASPNLNGT